VVIQQGCWGDDLGGLDPARMLLFFRGLAWLILVLGMFLIVLAFHFIGFLLEGSFHRWIFVLPLESEEHSCEGLAKRYDEHQKNTVDLQIWLFFTPGLFCLTMRW